jgi:flagellar biosynthetic protein FliQ
MSVTAPEVTPHPYRDGLAAGVGCALVAGLVLGMVQAATSINEATLTFVPKLIVVAICLALFGSAILMLLVDYTQDIFARIPELTR